MLVLLVLVVTVPSMTLAQDAKDESKKDDSPRWGISMWGLSYHINRTLEFTERNWGIGVRYDARPDWAWLGQNEANRVFVEADALRNSHNGLLLPLSAGAESAMGTVAGCTALAMGAFTLAYYRNPARGLSELKFGPVPGVVIACGHLRTNVTVVLSKSRQPLAAIVGSLTVMF
jgi:hypothetical protein